MKPLTPFITLLLTLAPLGQVALAVNTNPLGAMVVSVANNADQKFGIPFLRAPSFVGVTDSVSSGTVTVTGTVGDVTTEAHYLTVTSGTLEGSWYQVTGSTASSVTVAEDLQNEGLLAGDSLIVRPFWTLDTLFPNGGDVPASSDPFNPSALVFLNDPSATGINLAPPPDKIFFYYDGSLGGSPEWLDNDSLSSSGSTLVSPESFVTLRNASGSAASLIVSGSVPESPVNNDVVALALNNQDNLVFNPFPIEVTLDTSGLISSGAVRPSPDPFNPIDLVFIFPDNSTVINPAPPPDKIYFYYDGSLGGTAEWLDNDTLSSAGNAPVPEGTAFIIRKGSGTDSISAWSPPIPYSL